MSTQAKNVAIRMALYLNNRYIMTYKSLISLLILGYSYTMLSVAKVANIETNKYIDIILTFIIPLLCLSYIIVEVLKKKRKYILFCVFCFIVLPVIILMLAYYYTYIKILYL